MLSRLTRRDMLGLIAASMGTAAASEDGSSEAPGYVPESNTPSTSSLSSQVSPEDSSVDAEKEMKVGDEASDEANRMLKVVVDAVCRETGVKGITAALYAGNRFSHAESGMADI